MTINSIAEGRKAITDALVAAAMNGVDADIVELFSKASSNDVAPEAFNSFVETVYANADVLPDAIKTIGADVCSFCVFHSFYRINDDGRGDAIKRVLLGEEVENPPVIKQDFKAGPPEVIEVEVPPPPFLENPEGNVQ